MVDTAYQPRDRGWPLPNVWLGVSAEDQTRADERIPLLLDTPAAIRFVSCEPLLGPVDLTEINWDEGSWMDALRGESTFPTPGRLEFEKLDWVIVGGESGPHARPMHPNWALALRDQCGAAEVPFFFKQWGEWAKEDAITDKALLDISGPPSLLDKKTHRFSDGTEVYRVGKKAAGRLLDGRVWDEVPG